MSKLIRTSFRKKVTSFKEKTSKLVNGQNHEICYVELSSIATDIRSLGKDIDSLEECDYSLPVVDKAIQDLMPLLIEFELFASAQQMVLMFRNHVKDIKEMKERLHHHRARG